MTNKKQTFPHLLTVVGFCFLLATFMSYISYEPSYFGRWSKRWLMGISAAGLAALFSAWRWWSSRTKETPRLSIWSTLWLAAGVWALIYSWECW